MRFSVTATFLIILILILATFVANFANIISTDQKLAEKLNKNSNEHDSRSSQSSLHIGDDEKHLMWFLQISDIHISKFSNKGRVEELREFVNTTLDIIQPQVVLASGDLTDGKDSNHLGSRQHKDEWEVYKNILEEGNVAEKTIWMDIRGNHDNFNVPDINSVFNYFNKYSMQGDKHQRSYLYQISVGGDKYSFIAVDACLEPGPKRPFNFIGLLDTNETSLIIDLAEEARQSGGNYTVWFGHYPTSCILAPGTGTGGLRGIIGKYDESFVYLCGHLHTMAGVVRKMYTLQQYGFLELELGDWRDNRLFRVAAFDHGLFSFIDVKHNDWPIVLITNPKDSLFHLPKENQILQLESTHIRLLVFTDSKVTTCKVKIDNEAWRDCRSVTRNLFVAVWNPILYNTGLHEVSAMIRTEDGKSKLVRQHFSFDGSRHSFGLLARMVLMGDASKLFQALFGISLAFCVLPLCVLRIWHELIQSGKCKKPRLRILCCKNLIRKLWILSTIDRIFIPMIVYCIYITAGPWSIGEVIDEHIGVIFVWGIFVNNAFLPGSLTYLYGFFQLTFCQFPMIIIYGDIVDKRLKKLSSCSLRKRGKLLKYCRHIPFLFIIVVELLLAYFFWLAYGTLAFFVGPFRTWSIVLNFVLWYLARNIPEKCLSSAANIWHFNTAK